MDCPHAALKESEYILPNPNPVEIYLACSSACQHCDLLLKVVEAYKPGWINLRSSDQKKRLIEVGSWTLGPLDVNLLEVTADNTKATVGSFRYFRKPKNEPIYEEPTQDLDESHDGPWSGRGALYQSLEVISDSSSTTAIDRISKWLSHCVENDEHCKIPNPNYIPHRLLNVGSDEGRDPFLFEPKSPVPYVCLSYCWGPDTSGIVTTRVENLNNHYKGIAVSRLPQTIRDTIHLCRGLKLENLWIDSLCIVQDDRKSWLEDAAQMHQIYANSHLTVAGLEPHYCNGGILGEQDFGKSEWQHTIVIDVGAEGGGPGTEIFIRPGGVKQEFSARYSLDSRGWCLQESLLPNRRICFDGKEMSWECVSRKMCECGHVRWTSGLTNYGKLGGQIKHPTDTDYWSSSQTGWMGLVEDYSKRSLTRETDKLIALSGLAKLVSLSPSGTDTTAPEITVNALPDQLLSANNNNYLAGLWRDKFVLELAWRVVEHEKSKPTSYLGPSWSWASVNSAVLYDFREATEEWENKPTLEMFCTLNEVVCEAQFPSDLTGAVKSAYAILTGPLVPVELVTLDESLSKDWKDKVQEDFDRFNKYDQEQQKQRSTLTLVRGENLVSVEVHLDRRPAQEYYLNRDHTQANCWLEGWCEPQCCDWDARKSNSEDRRLFYCLRLFSWTCFIEGRAMPPELWFLVLQKSQSTEGAYERVGVGVWNPGFENREREWVWKGDEPDYCPFFVDAKVSTVKII